MKMTIAMRSGFAACAVVAALAFLVAPPAFAVQDAKADTAATVAEACRLLRADPEVRARFPGALDLCTPGAPAARACETRPVSDCTLDALCAVQTTFACHRIPCPPGGSGKPTQSTCVAGTIERHAARILRYPLCVRSGGTWEHFRFYSANAPWIGTCSCMGPSESAMAFTRNGSNPDSTLPRPLRYFVQGRGCVAEDVLCREHEGAWVARVPGRPRELPHCEIDGFEVFWPNRLPVGFPEVS